MPIDDSKVKGLDIWRADAVDLRPDLYRFVRYVQEKGLVRTHRNNYIPKGTARRLAKLLSYSVEAEHVEEHGHGLWSEHVCNIARLLGIVKYDTEGVYRGYTSTEPSFPDNEVQIIQKAWSAYLAKTPCKKEKALLEVQLKHTPNEFFKPPLLAPGEAFDRVGSAVGPASRMKLARVRRGLLELLAGLDENTWYELQEVIALLQEQRPNLILDPATREADDVSRDRLREWEYGRRGRKGKRPDVTLEDIYVNFREFDEGQERWRSNARQITAKTLDAFQRVEGRYLELFVSGIPYCCGFTELAFRDPSDRHGLDVHPPFQRLRALRLTPRFFQVMRQAPELDQVKVTVLPTFEILVEAPSYPEVVLGSLRSYAAVLREEAPVHHLRLERKKIVETAAQNPGARPVVELLQELSERPLPGNVASELASWSRHGEKVILYEGFGLLEFRPERTGPEERKTVFKTLGDLVEDTDLDGFALVKHPARAFDLLEKQLHVPARVAHRPTTFAPSQGRLAAPTLPAEHTGRPGPMKASIKKASLKTASPKKKKARLQSEDLVGYRSSEKTLLTALVNALGGEAPTCTLVGDDLLVLSASALPRLRATLRRLSASFDVTLAGNEPTS